MQYKCKNQIPLQSVATHFELKQKGTKEQRLNPAINR